MELSGVIYDSNTRNHRSLVRQLEPLVLPAPNWWMGFSTSLANFFVESVNERVYPRPADAVVRCNTPLTLTVLVIHKQSKREVSYIERLGTVCLVSLQD